MAFVPAYAFGVDGLDGPIDLWAALRGLFGHLWAHGDAIHLLTNMAALATFGPGVERALGPRRHLVLFVVAGVVGAVVEGLTSADRLMPLVGASGGISGVMAARVALHPASRLVAPILPRATVTLPLLALVGCDLTTNLGMAAWSATDFAPLDIDRVAWGAHLAGFAIGFAMAGWLRPKGSEWLRWRPDTAPKQFVGLGFSGRGASRAMTAVIWLCAMIATWGWIAEGQ